MQTIGRHYFLKVDSILGQRLEMNKRHQNELQECQSRTHQVKLLEKEHADEKKVSLHN